eukprot:TRINITY_DN17573_c0_g1_i1.p1 TRINITY_DN17573_c0_g1~~TRINITY_DN17573_c0_g1_i1.p1  ORF type:complete len:311 (+),score=63.47 TRINITY_DN17573_c0_g1_i1:10-942(+)
MSEASSEAPSSVEDIEEDIENYRCQSRGQSQPQRIDQNDCDCELGGDPECRVCLCDEVSLSLRRERKVWTITRMTTLVALPSRFWLMNSLSVLKITACPNFIHLPREVGQLSSLQLLDCSGNGIITIPSEIGKLTHLQSLFLHDNNIAFLPESIGDLHDLRHLSLSGNKLDTLPTVLGSLTSLTSLCVAANCLTVLPDSLASLSALQSLDASMNKLVRIPLCVRSLPKLSKLSLSVNNITQQPDEDFFTLCNELQEFSIAFNPISGESLSACTSLRKLPNLKSVDLRGIKFAKESEISFENSKCEVRMSG